MYISKRDPFEYIVEIDFHNSHLVELPIDELELRLEQEFHSIKLHAMKELRKRLLDK